MVKIGKRIELESKNKESMKLKEGRKKGRKEGRNEGRKEGRKRSNL